MIHPLLSARLFVQVDPRPEPPRPRMREPRPVRDFLVRVGAFAYRRLGPALGFLLGLAIAFWALLPAALR